MRHLVYTNPIGRAFPSCDPPTSHEDISSLITEAIRRHGWCHPPFLPPRSVAGAAYIYPQGKTRTTTGSFDIHQIGPTGDFSVQ